MYLKSNSVDNVGRHFLFIKAPPPSGTMPGDWTFMYMYVIGIDYAFVAKIFGLEFGTVLAVWYITFFILWPPHVDSLLSK